MTRSGILRLRLLLSAFGFAIWAYGARNDQSTALWIGLGVMALALVARFIPVRSDTDGDGKR